MKAIDYIELVRTKKGWSYYKIARYLQVSDTAVGQMRSGRTKTLTDASAIAIAEILEVDPIEIIADQSVERSKGNKTVEQFWTKYIATAAIISALVMPQAIESQGHNRCFNDLTPYRLCAILKGSVKKMSIEIVKLYERAINQSLVLTNLSAY